MPDQETQDQTSTFLKSSPKNGETLLEYQYRNLKMYERPSKSSYEGKRRIKYTSNQQAQKFANVSGVSFRDRSRLKSQGRQRPRLNRVIYLDTSENSNFNNSNAFSNKMMNQRKIAPASASGCNRPTRLQVNSAINMEHVEAPPFLAFGQPPSTTDGATMSNEELSFKQKLQSLGMYKTFVNNGTAEQLSQRFGGGFEPTLSSLEHSQESS